MYKKIIFFIFSSILFKSSFAMIRNVPKEVTAKIFCFLLNPEKLDTKYGQKTDFGKKLFSRLAELALLNKSFLDGANYYKKTYFFGEDKKVSDLCKQDKYLYNACLHRKILKRVYKIVDNGHRGKDFTSSDIKDLVAHFICIKNKTFETEIIDTIIQNDCTNEFCLSLAGEFGILDIIKYFVEHKISEYSIEYLLPSLSGSANNGNVECLKLSINGLKKALIEYKLNGNKQNLQEKSLGEILNLCNFSKDDYSTIKGYIGIGFVGAFLNNYKNVTNMLEKELISSLINAGISFELFDAASWGNIEKVKKIIKKYGNRSIYSGYSMRHLEDQCKKTETRENSHVCLELIKKWRTEYEFWANSFSHV